jgi:hypothetical protein
MKRHNYRYKDTDSECKHEQVFEELQIEYNHLQTQLDQRKKNANKVPSPQLTLSPVLLPQLKPSPPLKPKSPVLLPQLKQSPVLSNTSPITSPTLSPIIITSKILPSVCMICKQKSVSEYVLTWKECNHSVITIPELKL